jgi:hypothetical protein
MRGRIKFADKNDDNNNNNNNIDDGNNNIDDDDDEKYISSISRGYYHARCSHRLHFSYHYVLILFWIVMTDSVLLFSEGLSSSSSSASYPPSSSSEESPWASATWLLKLDFCRSKQSSSSSSSSSQQKQNDNTGSSNNKNNNDAPFTSYGALGSRLVVNFPVMVDADDDMNNKQYPDKFVGRGASVIRPYYDADDDDEEEEESNRNKNTNNYFEYITMKGTQRIELSQGGWTVEFPSSGIYNRGKATKLKFYLDLVTDLERNDIVLPAGTRLYFTTKCWREQEYDYGLIKIKPIRDEFQIAQQILDDQLSHESGDRRLDGNDPIETLKAYTDMTKLVLNRDRKRMELRNAINGQRDYGHGYPGSDDHPEGPWPGSTEWLTISENNPIYARVPKKNNKNKNNLLQQLMSKGGGGGGENDYHFGRVGTWTGEAISSLLLEDDE